MKEKYFNALVDIIYKFNFSRNPLEVRLALG